MPVSQNGYTAGNESLLTTITIPGGRLRVRKGPVADIFTYLAQRFNDEVEPIAGPVLDDWGYALRLIRGGVSTSNHGSGTAIDLNATKHPLGVKGTFTRKLVKAIHAILADLDGAVRWGGDYSGRVDEMHFEINADAAKVTEVAARLKEEDMPTADEVADATVAKLLRARLTNSHDGVEASLAAWLVYGNEKAGLARDNSASAVKAVDDLRAALPDAVAAAVKAAIADGTIKVQISVNGVQQ